MEPLISPNDVARIINRCPETVRRLLRAGKIPGAIKFNRTWLISEAAVRAWYDAGLPEASTVPAVEPPDGTKVCKDCGRKLPRSAYQQKSKNGRPYLVGRCRECEAARRRAKRAR